ncbi:MAG: RluA family pseudouridine synthase [Planctomycetaceae bacterium]|jgi:23S rRNA pseudouridine1911/1915/1917 synthase|nr:RluA family pseudouridine synthase [Planctomycetaceae bacterium]
MLEILYEDNHLLVISKPVGVATMGLPENEVTLLTLAREYIKQKYNKPGNVYLGVVSRLDVPVSGVVLFARTSKAADRINEQFRSREVKKEYIALVEGVTPTEMECNDWLIEDERHRSVHVTKPNTPNAKEAILLFERIKLLGNNSLIKINLKTGRKHQIRVQLSTRGYPILGDRKYGAKTEIASGITLHAQKLTIQHPTKEETITITAPIPKFWGKYGVIGEY